MTHLARLDIGLVETGRLEHVAQQNARPLRIAAGRQKQEDCKIPSIQAKTEIKEECATHWRH